MTGPGTGGPDTTGPSSAPGTSNTGAQQTGPGNSSPQADDRTTRLLANTDRTIALAWQRVLDCRRAWARRPNADTVRAHDQAEAELNRALERRYWIQTRPR